MTLLRNNLDEHKKVIKKNLNLDPVMTKQNKTQISTKSTFCMTFSMKEPTFKNNIDEFKPIFKSWNEVSQKVSIKYETNSLGEMAFLRDESWSLHLHNIFTTSHCRKLSWRCCLPTLSNTYRNLPLLPAARRNPGHTGSCHGAGWLPTLYRTCIGICLSYQQQAEIQGTKQP